MPPVNFGKIRFIRELYFDDRAKLFVESSRELPSVLVKVSILHMFYLLTTGFMEEVFRVAYH